VDGKKLSIDSMKQMSLDEFIQYVDTWSGLKTYKLKHPEKDVLGPLYTELKHFFPNVEQPIEIHFPIVLFLGHKRMTS